MLIWICGVTQLAARIKELKAMGHEFKTEWIKVKNRYGKNTSVKAYKLVERKEV